tara:strand:- start:2236 stop:2421 length:186 start_codon:yes stop_codon:yes gene_type:complete
MPPLFATFKKVKLLYQNPCSVSYTNRQHKYHMLDYKEPPREITKYGHFNYAQKLIKAGNYA